MRVQVTGSPETVARIAGLASSLGWPVEQAGDPCSLTVTAPEVDVLRFLDLLALILR